jgi:hypothetical protein
LANLFSHIRKNAIRIVIIALIIAVATPSIMLYLVYRDYYYERNMRRYAMGMAYLDVKDSFSYFAYCVNTNTSTLPEAITEELHVQDSADRLEYMDPPNYLVWWRLSKVYEKLDVMVQISFFPNGSGTERLKPDEVYSYILAFNDTITQAQITMGYTFSTSDSIYNPDANSFQLNQTKLLEMDDIGRRFLSSEPLP